MNGLHAYAPNPEIHKLAAQLGGQLVISKGKKLSGDVGDFCCPNTLFMAGQTMMFGKRKTRNDKRTEAARIGYEGKIVCFS